jgi:crotonobetainyl-CoA:carnitine CoA-transferase CaiB-like acyl-CoA transferase
MITDLWRAAHGDSAALARLELSGRDPVLPSRFSVGTLAQATIAASGLAAAEVWRARTGRHQTVSVDMRHAVAAFRSERYLKLEDAPSFQWDKIAGLYRCRDGWVRIHTNFAQHRDGILQLLGCGYDRDAVQAALMGWDKQGFETAAADAGLCATAFRSLPEWAAHPQGQAVAALPLLEIMRIGDAPPRPFKADPVLPLSGIRVLEMTRVIAGPVAGRTLAAHGADVLYVSAARLPNMHDLIPDTGRGKRSTLLDLADAGDAATVAALASTADVFLQGYRPGALAAHGLAPEQLAARNPGIVCVALSAYSHVGPWAARRGFDSLTQNANGLNHAEAEAVADGKAVDRPKELPAQALDHAAGYLLAFGAMMALRRRAVEGGSWLVRTSLAQVGEALKRLPQPVGGPQTPDLAAADVSDLLEASSSGFGPMLAVRHAAQLSETPAKFKLPAARLGTHEPIWL